MRGAERGNAHNSGRKTFTGSDYFGGEIGLNELLKQFLEGIQTWFPAKNTSGADSRSIMNGSSDKGTEGRVSGAVGQI